MSKNFEVSNEEKELEKIINSYIEKSIWAESKNYQKKIFLKNQKEVLVDSLDEIAEEIMEGTIYEDENLHRGEFTLEEILNEEEHFEDMDFLKAFRKLSNAQKEAIFLKSVHGLSEPKISKILGVTKQAVAKRRISALKKLISEYLED